MKQATIGRNDPCICGSGKKYKKCCGDEANSEQIRPDIEENIAEVILLIRNDNFLEATRICKYLLEYYPDNSKVLYHCALSLFLSGHFQLSEALAKKAIIMDPNCDGAYYLLANMYYNGKLFTQALNMVEEAIKINPKDLRYLYQKAMIFAFFYEKREEVVRILKNILKDHPQEYQAYQRLHSILIDLEKYDEAEEIYQQLLSLNPPFEIIIPLMTMIPRQIFSKQDLLDTRKKFEENLDYIYNQDVIINDLAKVQGYNVSAFALNYHGINSRYLLEKQAAVIRKIAPDVNYEADFIKNHQTAANGRIKIGFLSAAFKITHPLMHCFYYILEHLARSDDFEVVFFDIGSSGKENPLVKEGLVEHIAMTSSFNASSYAQIIDQRCDILAQLDPGSDGRSYLLAFARLAPVQLCFTGQPITTGLSTMDYYISSDLWEPEDAADHYTEKLIRLKNPVMSMKKPDISAAKEYKREDFGMPLEGNLYACPATLHKIHPDFYPIVIDILKKDPNGYFLFFKDVRNNYSAISDNFQKIAPDVSKRILFLNWIKSEDFPHAMNLCDVVLDPVHFGLATTLYKLFNHAIPVVTWPGDLLPGRVTYGLYKWMGIDDMIAKNFADYADIAVKIATDKQYNLAMRKKIKHNCDIIYGDTGAAEEVADIFKNIVHQ